MIMYIIIAISILILLLIGWALHTKYVKKRFNEIVANYEDCTIEEKIWAFCFSEDLEVKSYGLNDFSIKNSSSEFLSATGSSITWFESYRKEHSSLYSLENVEALLNKKYNLKRPSRVFITAHTVPKRRKVKKDGPTDLSYLLEGVTDPEEILVLESVILRERQLA